LISISYFDAKSAGGLDAHPAPSRNSPHLNRTATGLP
jgi:hypothetical protein